MIFDTSIVGLSSLSFVFYVQKVSRGLMGIWINFPNFQIKMVNRPDSSSTRSDKSSSSRSSSMNRGNSNKSSFVRSKSGNDYNEKSAAQNRLRNSTSMQSVAKSGSKTGMRKFKSNGRLVFLNVDLIVTLAMFDWYLLRTDFIYIYALSLHKYL